MKQETNSLDNKDDCLYSVIGAIVTLATQHWRTKTAENITNHITCVALLNLKIIRCLYNVFIGYSKFIDTTSKGIISYTDFYFFRTTTYITTVPLR